MSFQENGYTVEDIDSRSHQLRTSLTALNQIVRKNYKIGEVLGEKFTEEERYRLVVKCRDTCHRDFQKLIKSMKFFDEKKDISTMQGELVRLKEEYDSVVCQSIDDIEMKSLGYQSGKMEEEMNANELVGVFKGDKIINDQKKPVQQLCKQFDDLSLVVKFSYDEQWDEQSCGNCQIL